jgi:hypothetical protein
MTLVPTAMLDHVLVSSRRNLVPANRLTSGTVKHEMQQTLPHLCVLKEKVVEKIDVNVYPFIYLVLVRQYRSDD